MLPASGRPEIDYDASGVRLSPQLNFDVKEPGTAPVKISAPMTGFYNVYNILAVFSVLRQMNLPTDKFNEVLRSFRPQFGRGEVFHVGANGGQRVLLNLAKNPAGFGQNISAMLQDRSPKDLIIVINDNAQDGRDVSWLWDVDFDRLADCSCGSSTWRSNQTERPMWSRRSTACSPPAAKISMYSSITRLFTRRTDIWKGCRNEQ